MAFQEKRLYHQIHPLKLFTDWSTGLIALPLLWRRRLGPALLVGVVPSIVVSGLLVRWVDLEPYKRSAFGHYMKRSMTPTMQAMRSVGYVVMALGAWYRRPGFLPLGLVIILFGWLRGKLFP